MQLVLASATSSREKQCNGTSCVSWCCKLSINLFANPNPVYIHSYTWQYIEHAVTRAHLLTASCCRLLDFPFDAQDGGIAFLRNTGQFLPDHTVSHPDTTLQITVGSEWLWTRRQTLHSKVIKVWNGYKIDPVWATSQLFPPDVPLRSLPCMSPAEVPYSYLRTIPDASPIVSAYSLKRENDCDTTVLRTGTWLRYVGVLDVSGYPCIACHVVKICIPSFFTFIWQRLKLNRRSVPFASSGRLVMWRARTTIRPLAFSWSSWSTIRQIFMKLHIAEF
jgi:hypothetical protein